MHDRDSLQRFLFEHYDIRGEIVHLNAAWHEILVRHEYPDVIQKVLGEMVAATVLLSATLKFNGSLIMQLQSDGPLTLAIIEATSDRTIRGVAEWNDESSDLQYDRILGDGILAVTIDSDDGDRYQGIVDLESGSIATALENYMLRSQQLETRLWLASDKSQSVGMLLQRMPSSQSSVEMDQTVQDLDAWNRITQLANTIEESELKLLPFSEVIHRLFHEEDVRVFEAEPVSFRCSCTRDKVRDMLKMLGYDEVKSVLETEGKVGVNCQFCNHYYGFDQVDVEEVFATDIPGQSTDTKQ